MNRSRSILATVLALGGALAACSSAPEAEDTGAAAAPVLVEHCPFGQTPSCTTTRGATTCTCVVQQVQCDQLPATLPRLAYEAAWAVVPRSGECPTIAGDGGTWAEIGTTPPGFSPLPSGSNGVPNDTAPTPPSCTSVFPTATFPACCTYVWWPIGLGTAASQASQDDAAICTSNTVWMEELYESSALPPCPIDAGKCKGSDDCPTCHHPGE